MHVNEWNSSLNNETQHYGMGGYLSWDKMDEKRINEIKGVSRT